jgi:uncharacterized membrane protein required for colicin V production
MNIIDAIIILIILFCAVLGFKKGFTKELVSFLGFFIIVFAAFILKNPISKVLYDTLPFFSFGGFFKGVTALNIILYEIIAFFIVVAILTVIFKVLLFATSVFEKLLKFTIVLGIPSKILGMITGVIEGITWSFILVYILSLPLFEFNDIKNSTLAEQLLTNTPILSTFTKDFKDAMDEFSLLKEEYEVEDNKQEFNYKTLDILLKYKIITPESAKKLNEKGKLKIDNADALINLYQE